MRGRCQIALLLAIFVCVAFGATAQYVADTKFEQELLSTVNGMRANSGLPALRPDARLKQAALKHLAKSTAGEGEFSVIELNHVGRMGPSYTPRTDSYILRRQLRLAAWGLKSQIPQAFFYDFHDPNGSVMGEGPIANTFENANIRAITIYSRDHSEFLSINGIPASVQSSEIDPKAYYDTYVLLCTYLRKIDRDLGR
jgi:hypothetical protein